MSETLSNPTRAFKDGYVYGDNSRFDILRMVPPDGKVIGSVGCGMAGTETVLMKQGREVHGVDISSEAIAIAATRLTSARVVSPDERHPFADQSLDGLILADVIEHLPQAWEALRDFSRAVKPGGWVVISVPNMRSPLLAQFLIKGDWPERPRGVFDSTHLQVLSQKRLARWCDLANLSIEKWFDNYGPSKYRFKLGDRLTLKFFHSWFMYQLQCVCRVRNQPTPATSVTQ